jgi:hypothetical protein
MNTNHDCAETVAAAPRAVIEANLMAEFKELAGMLLANTPNLTPNDRQRLKDIQRDGRVQARWLVEMVKAAAKCEKDSKAYAIGARINALIASTRPHKPTLTLVQAVCERSKEQAEADVALVHAALAQNDPGALRRAEAELLDQRSAVDHAIAALRSRLARLARPRVMTALGALVLLSACNVEPAGPRKAPVSGPPIIVTPGPSAPQASTSVSRIVVTPTNAVTVPRGIGFLFGVEVYDAAGARISPPPELRWSVVDALVGTIDSTGAFAAFRPTPTCQATVRATVGPVFGSARVEVQP